MRTLHSGVLALLASTAVARSLVEVPYDNDYDGNTVNNNFTLSARAVSSMSSLFTVDSTCGNRDMDGILIEAQEMVTGAISALDELMNSNVHPLTRTYDIQRKILAAVAAFGITNPSLLTLKLSSADKAILTSAKTVFSGLSATLKSGTGIDKDNAFLYCDSTNLKWADKKATDVFHPPLLPAGSKDTIEQFFQNQANPKQEKGLWYDPHHQSQHMQVPFPDQYNGKPMCGSNQAEGITFRQPMQRIIICPKAWTSYKPSIKADRGKTGPIQWDDYRSTPGVFLHEMLHRADTSITDKAVKIGSGTNTGYGLYNVYTLANIAPNNKADALKNADSFNVFATMMYLPHADWE